MRTNKYFFLFYITVCLTISLTHTYAQEVIILSETTLSKNSKNSETRDFLDSRKINSELKAGKYFETKKMVLLRRNFRG